jgi:hypothetical protein
MSSLSELFPAGAGKQVSFTASENISSGDNTIINSNGTATSVSGSFYVSGAPVQTVTGYNTSSISAASDGTRVLFGFRSSDFGYVTAGTLSGLSASFTTPTNYCSNCQPSELTMAYGDGVFVLAYSGASNYGNSAVIRINSNGSVITSAPVIFNSNAITEPTIVFGSTSAGSSEPRFVIFYKRAYYGRAIVGTVTNNVISFGSEYTFEGTYTSTESISACFDSNANKFVVAYRGNGGLTVKVGTVSGTSISFGSSTLVSSDVYSRSVGYPCTFDSANNKVVLVYPLSLSGDYELEARVGTVSGTSISFGSATSVPNGTSFMVRKQSAVFDPSKNSSVLMYRDSAQKWYVAFGVVSGTTVNFIDPVLLNDGNGISNDVNCAAYVSGSENIVLFWYGGATTYVGDRAQVAVSAGTNVSADNFLGVADEAISNGSSGNITVKGGVATTFSGLTPQKTYYVQNDGSLAADAGIPYQLSRGSYTEQSLDVSSQTSNVQSMRTSADGTKFYVGDYGTNRVYQYDATSAWEAGSATYASKSLSVASQETTGLYGFVFSDSGSKLYVIGALNDVFQYTLSTPYDLSTASYASISFDVGSSGANYPMIDIEMSPDGTKMYLMTNQTYDRIYQFTLSTPYDVSTASYASKSLDVSSEDTQTAGFTLSSDGTKLLTVGYNTTPDSMYRYDLTTAYDLATASFSNQSLAVDSQNTVPVGVGVKTDGTRVYMLGNSGGAGGIRIFQYRTAPASTSVIAGVALSATSVDLDYST